LEKREIIDPFLTAYKKSERETNHERLWTPGTKLRVTEGSGG